MSLTSAFLSLITLIYSSQQSTVLIPLPYAIPPIPIPVFLYSLSIMYCLPFSDVTVTSKPHYLSCQATAKPFPPHYLISLLTSCCLRQSSIHSSLLSLSSRFSSSICRLLRGFSSYISSLILIPHPFFSHFTSLSPPYLSE